MRWLLVRALAREQIFQRNQRPAFASFDGQLAMPRLGQKILERRQQIRTQASPFLPDSFEIFSFEQPCKKSLSEILCFLWLVTFASDEAVQWPPVGSAKLLQRRLRCRCWTLRCQHHAPMCGGKYSSTVLSAFTSRPPRCSASYRRHDTM